MTPQKRCNSIMDSHAEIIFFCLMFIVPVEKKMNFAPFGGPEEIFVCILVPTCD